MGVPPAKLHEKPAKANKWEQEANMRRGFSTLSPPDGAVRHRTRSRPNPPVTPAVFAAGSLNAGSPVGKH
jgi:hypothetical protein